MFIASRWCVHCTHLQSLFTSLPICRFSEFVQGVHKLQSLFTSLPNCRFSVVCTLYTPAISVHEPADLSLLGVCAGGAQAAILITESAEGSHTQPASIYFIN